MRFIFSNCVACLALTNGIWRRYFAVMRHIAKPEFRNGFSPLKRDFLVIVEVTTSPVRHQDCLAVDILENCAPLFRDRFNEDELIAEFATVIEAFRSICASACPKNDYRQKSHKYQCFQKNLP